MNKNEIDAELNAANPWWRNADNWEDADVQLRTARQSALAYDPRRARLAWREEGPLEALRVLEAGGPIVGLPYSTAGSIDAPHLDAQYLRSVLLGELGRTAESRAWLDSLVDDYMFVIQFLPLVRSAAIRFNDPSRR